MNNDRMPRVGDLIVQKHKPDYQETSTGIVIEIKRDKYTHGSVFIHWFDDEPHGYQKRYGYAEANIHNCRSEFDVCRDGKFLK